VAIVFAVLSIGSLVVWRFTDWLGADDPLRGFGLCWSACIFGAVSLHYAAEWFRPSVRECWLHEGVFGWRSSRRPRSAGQVELSQVRVLRVSRQDYFQLLTSTVRYDVPLECVQDFETIAALIQRAAPHISLE
jgi:hypothetical protein